MKNKDYYLKQEVITAFEIFEFSGHQEPNEVDSKDGYFHHNFSMDVIVSPSTKNLKEKDKLEKGFGVEIINMGVILK